MYCVGQKSRLVLKSSLALGCTVAKEEFSVGDESSRERGFRGSLGGIFENFSFILYGFLRGTNSLVENGEVGMKYER